MATSDRMKSLAVHFEKVVYAGAGVLALVVFLIPFLSTRDLADSYYKVDEAKSKFIGDQGKDFVPPPAPNVKAALEKQWSVDPAPFPWVTPWTPEVKPQLIRLKPDLKPEPLKHEPGKVAKLTAVRDAKKLLVFLRIEGARGATHNAKVKSAKLQRKVIAPAPDAGSDFADLKDFGAGQAVKHDDLDVKPGFSYVYRLVTEVEPSSPDVEMPKDDNEPLKKTSNELPLQKVIPWDYRIRIISATGYDAKTGAAPSLSGEVWYWDHVSGKTVKLPKTDWKEKDTFGPKVSGQDRYLIQQIEDGKAKVQDRATKDLRSEILSAKENKRDVDLPPEVTAESVAAAAAAPPEEAASKAASKKAEAKSKAKAPEDDVEGEGTEKKPAKKPAGKDSKTKDTKGKTPKKKPVIK